MNGCEFPVTRAPVRWGAFPVPLTPIQGTAPMTPYRYLCDDDRQPDPGDSYQEELAAAESMLEDAIGRMYELGIPVVAIRAAIELAVTRDRKPVDVQTDAF